jgi:hypothetical protein
MEVFLMVFVFIGAAVFFHLRASVRERRRPRSNGSDAAAGGGSLDWPCDTHAIHSHSSSHGDAFSHGDGSSDGGDCGGGDGGD